MRDSRTFALAAVSAAATLAAMLFSACGFLNEATSVGIFACLVTLLAIYDVLEFYGKNRSL